MDAALTQDTANPVRDAPTQEDTPRSSRWRAIWSGARAAVGALLGLVPHVLHHIGFLAGAAVLTGAVGNALLYVAGLALSIPMLDRIRKRHHTWKASLIAVVVFTGLFAFSAFIVGPALNPPSPQPAPIQQPTAAAEHEDHHR